MTDFRQAISAERARDSIGFERKGEPKVAIIVLNFNGKRWLGRCLSSLKKLSYANLEIRLIDNGSSDGSVEYVKSEFPWVGITAYSRNFGYALSHNLTIRNVDAYYILLLNNDTEVMTPWLVEDLVRSLESDKSAAAATCKMLFMDDPTVINSVGGTGIKFWRGFSDVGFGEKDRGQYDDPPIEPFSLCGGASLIRRDLYVSAGGFDSQFFAYSEDVDLSWRLRLQGYRIRYVPSAIVLHHFSGSLAPEHSEQLKLFWTRRNLLRMIIKNCANSTLRWALTSVLAHLLAMLLWFSITDPMKARRIADALGWNLRNLRDTIRERYRIQLSRSTSDEEIIAFMYKPFRVRQGRQFPSLSRIADLLFGASQAHSVSKNYRFRRHIQYLLSKRQRQLFQP